MKTGVIGLGTMGAAMARNLHKSNKLHCAWNRTLSKAKQLAETYKLPIASRLGSCATECDLLILSLSADSDVIEVVEALRPDLNAGTLVVDTSTTSVDTAVHISERLASVGCNFVDAPVSGGSEGARKGTLVMMAGGDKAHIDSMEDALSPVYSKLVHMGDTGSGQATKSVNQLMMAGINQAVTESLAFGSAQNLDMDKLIDLVGSGAAGNWFLSHRGKSMLEHSFNPGFRMVLHHKDLLICKEIAKSLGVQLPLIEMTLIHYQRLMDTGYGDEDISALFRSKQMTYEKT